MAWAAFPRKSSSVNKLIDAQASWPIRRPPFAVQLVQQMNYGPIESKRYFIPDDNSPSEFNEVLEDSLIQANFQKLNTYVRCTSSARATSCL
jgi:hypothetical protein